jgi:hypothetical protein
MNGIATVVISWEAKRLKLCNPPRSTVHGERGAPLGKPHDAAGQRAVLEQSLALLGQAAPLKMKILDGRET